MTDHKKNIIQLREESKILGDVIRNVKELKNGKTHQQESTDADLQLEQDLKTWH